ncbi:MAG: protoporphyrinogen/coproporphyrinogen oxidase [Blastocatellia bacterium]
MATLIKPTVTVIGAGFSGLTAAYYLLRAGARVRVIERSDRAGGLLGTRRTEHGLVETAANGILNSARLEALCADIGVTLLAPRPESRARFIWRDHPRRWPLGVGETLRLGAGLLGNAARLRPFPQETVAAWGERVLGAGATRYALLPALGGIYAGDGRQMSAGLIFRRGPSFSSPSFSSPSFSSVNAGSEKPRRRGTVAPSRGMQELVDCLTDRLRERGAELLFNQTAEIRAGAPSIVCAQAPQAASLLRETAPAVSECLDRIEMLPLVTATCFYAHHPAHPRGFGCLFPRDQGFRARGALFNDCLFEGRSDVRSETWILGGALDREIPQMEDEDLKRVLAADHARLTGRDEPPLSVHIIRWPHALPHYNLDLERALAGMPPLPRGLALSGNYLGQIGLGRILHRSAHAAARILEAL